MIKTAEGSRSAVDRESSLADLLRLDKELKEFSKKESQNRKDEERTRAQALSLGKRIAAIEALAPAVESGILELSKSRDSLRQRVAQLSARMTDVDASLADLPADLSQGRTSLQSAIDRWAAHVNEAAATMGRARQMLTALERVQALVTNAEQGNPQPWRSYGKHRTQRTVRCAEPSSTNQMMDRLGGDERGNPDS